MKNSTRFGAAVVVGAGFLFPFLAGAGVYAAGPQIKINNGAEDLYTASGTKASTDGTVSYDSATSTITLNGFEGSNIIVSGMDSLTLSLAGENILDMDTTDNVIPQGVNAGSATLNITGSGSLKVNRSDLPSFGGSSASVIKAGNIVIDSVNLDLSANAKSCVSSANDGQIVVKSGNLSLSCNTALQAGDIIINGGSTVVNGKLSSSITMSKNLTMNSGSLTVNAESIGLGSAMTFHGDVEINGGEINVHGGQDGITFTNLSGTLGQIGHFAISGGYLNIDGVDHGIVINDASNDSYIDFSGGTTIIDSKYGVAKIVYDTENEKNIMIGDKMNLYPEDLSVEFEFKDYSGVWQEYIYYLAEDGEAAKTAVITDDDIVIPDDDADDVSVPDTAVKTPNTGSNAEGHEYVMAFASVIPAVIISILGVRKYVQNSKKIKFDY